MAIKNTLQRGISPIHPGEALREDFMPDYGLTTATLAEALGVSRQTVNEILREKRAALNLTQEQFAARVGVTVSTVNRWENGKGKPSPLARIRIQEFWLTVKDGDAEMEKH